MITLENKFQKSIIWSALNKLMRFGLIVSGVLVTLITFVSVIARAFNFNLIGYEEILIIFAFWLYMFGSAHGSFEDSHIKADIFIISLKEGLTKDLVIILRDSLSVFLGIVFFLWAIQLAKWNIETGQVTPTWRIPVLVSQSSLLFGLGIGTLFNLVYLYNKIKRMYFKWIKKVEINELNE